MRNLYTVLGKTTHKTHETERLLGSSFGKVGKRINFSILLIIFLSIVGFQNANSQIALIPAADGGFENATSAFPNNGWTAVGTSARTWRVGTFGGSATGTKAAYWGTAAAYGGSAAAAVGHFYRDIVIPAGATSVFLNYKLKYPTVDANWDYFYVFTTTTANTPVNGTIPAAGYTQRFVNTATAYAGFSAMPQIDLTSLAGTTVRLVFTFKTDAATPNAAPAVDDITLTYLAPAACAGIPTSLASSSITSTSANISWAAATPAPASGYQYYYSTSATAPTGATTPSGSTAAGVTTASLTGLTANTTYYYWVRANCGGTGVGNWSSSGSFYTGYCTPSATSVDGTGITNVTFGNGPTVNNTTGAEANNYGNYSAQSGGLYQGQSGTVAITFTTSIYDYNTVIWVDWNNDLDFADAGEQVYTGLSGTTAPNTLNASFTVPGTATIGATYRMRIGAGDAAAPGSCTTGATYTCFEDYSIKVLAPCVPAGNQTAYGAGSWIGYVYNSATPGAFTTYSGFVTEATTFNRTHTSATGATTNLCFNNQDLFTIRYKNTTNFPAAYYTFSVGGDDGVRFSIDGGATWLINNWIDQGYTVSSNPIPVYLSGNVNMVFEYYENSGGAQSSFSYISSPACAGTPTPGNTVASATQVISGGTSNLSLQNATTGGGVTYQWQSSASSSGPWAIIAGATNPTYTATITANTWYQCVVTCTASTATAVSSPVQITLTYCSPSALSVDGSGITNVTFGVGPIVNNTTGAEANNYGNYSAQAGGLVQGASATVAITFTTSIYDYNTVIWVDWNNDLDFADAGEQVYTGLSGTTAPNTLNATFTVPATAVVGANYRMRIGAGDAAAPSYCTTGASYTCFEDYTITVITPPACATPSALVGTITSTTAATLTWTAPASVPASGYNYFYSTVNTAPTGSTIPSGSTSAGVTTASISGLTPNTTYYFWVQSNCGGTGTSAWAGSSSFVTSFVVPASGSNTYTTCSGTLYDNGGAAGNYAASSNGTTVIYPGTPGASVSLTFTSMDVESGWDYVYVYNGNSSAAAQVAGSPFSGTTIPATIVSTAVNGALTVVFTSDGSGQYTGFAANISCISPCAGTPTPGATTATSAQVFAAGSTTLGIATLQPTGTIYQWQSSASASGPWTNIGGATAATYVASPTTATYYQCIVTCAAASASATSTPIQITVNPYCQPVYTTGKTDGDLISNIAIAGTTLSNNSGTAATNPSYTFFTGQPNYTCDLVAANSYTVNVTVGTWGSQGIAAWIDYNDNNIFEASELIGSTATTIGTGTGGTPIPANHTASFTINLSCTPPLGTHRMRVRDVYFVNGPTIDPCATYTFGETEDYLVTIISGPAFTPAFTTTPAATSCIGTTVNYVATAGQTNYAWTFAGTAGTDYTLVSGGTSTSNTASVTWITGGAHSMTMNYASPLGCASSGAVSNTVTMPTAGSSLAQNNENATCTVNQNGWVHFYHSSGRLIGSINSQGQNLGNVTVTSYVDGTNALVPACANPNPIYSTSVMQRHWVITPTTQPTTPVLVRFPYSNAEFSGLTSAASTNANSNDDLLTPADLGMTKYSNGTAANVNSDPLDNCGVGTATFHTQLGTGLATSYSGVSANYVDFSIPGFSEFWLHGSAQASPLPVELVNFQANCAGEGKVEVTWATASEHNSANFTVEKSRDGINWTVMASLAGAGNSTQMINYSTADNNAAAGVNYYRLTQTDFDGASETFNIASANCGDNSPLTTVKVYPNPSAGDFYIDFTSEEIIGSSVVTVTDARGMEVYKMNVTVEKGNNVFHIDHTEAAPGMYYIQVSNGTATSNIVKHSLR